MPPPRRARLSRSRLAEPGKPVYELARRFQEYLFLPDPRPLYALLGAYAGNHIPGSPIWLMLVGSSSCGGTEMLTSMVKLPGIYKMDDVSGTAAFLSGTPKHDVAKDATGGLLRRIGNCGGVVIKDYTTTVLSLPRDSRIRVMGALRGISDGSYDREIGGEGGRTITWEGKAACYTKCTHAIEQHNAMNRELGDRWLYWRYGVSSGFGESRMAVLRDGVSWRETLQNCMADFIEGIGIRDLYTQDQYKRWVFKGNYLDRDRLEGNEWSRIVAMAMLGARCASAVHRDHNREVDDIVYQTDPPRLAGWLAELYLGMEICGLDEDVRWDVVGKVALDGMPGLRRAVLGALRAARQRMREGEGGSGLMAELGGEWVAVHDVEAGVKSSSSSVRRAIEDLVLHGVVERDNKQVRAVRIGVVRLTEWAVERLREGWGEARDTRQERLF